MAVTPLWQDIDISIDDVNSILFRVYNSRNMLIYQGYGTSPDGDVVLRLNDIFADALGERTLSWINTNGTAATEKRYGYDIFRVDLPALGTSTSYEVVADYSYAPIKVIASEPITGVIDRRQHMFLTYWDEGENFNVFEVKRNGNYSPIGSTMSGGITYGIGPSTLSDSHTLIVFSQSGEEVNFEVEDTCADYVLHYINAYGGWDSMVMLGRCSKGEDYSRYIVGRNHSHTSSITPINAIGKVVTANEVVKKWTLRTGLLTDVQSSRMHHLLGSQRAFLEDLNDGSAYPVVITNSSYEEQSFRGNGNRMSQYEILVELAQNRIRR